jgi:hypothetical protein
VIPATFAPGRARLATRPGPTASALMTITIRHTLPRLLRLGGKWRGQRPECEPVQEGPPVHLLDDLVSAEEQRRRDGEPRSVAVLTLMTSTIYR